MVRRCDLGGAVQRQQGAGVAHVQVARHQHGLHRLDQIQQAQQIGCGAARAPHGLRGQLVRQAEFFHQPVQALGFFERVQVFALDVFNQRHRGGGLVGHVADQHRQAVQPGQRGSAKTPLARNDFVFAAVAAAAQAPHQNRLHDALRLDGFGQIVQRALVHAGARLVLTGHYVAQAQRGRQAGAARRAAQRLRVINSGAEQHFKPATQAFLSFGNHRACLSLKK